MPVSSTPMTSTAAEATSRQAVTSRSMGGLQSGLHNLANRKKNLEVLDSLNRSASSPPSPQRDVEEASRKCQVVKLLKQWHLAGGSPTLRTRGLIRSRVVNEEDDLPLSAPEYFRVGGFLIRPTLKAIRPFHGFDAPSSAEKDRRLPDKAIAVLMKLAEQPRVVFSREQLLDEVWGEDREAYDRVLDNAISELRKAFGDNARNPRYIETITKQGYRLIAQVEWPKPDMAGPEDAATSDVADSEQGATDAAGGTGTGGVETDRVEPGQVETGRVDASFDQGAPASDGAEHESADGNDGSADEPADDAASAAPPRADPSDLPPAAGSIRYRGFYGLFAILAIVLLGAVAAFLLWPDTRTVWIAQVPNQTGDAAYDRLDELIRQRIQQSGCSSPSFEETDYFFLATVSIEGKAEFDGETIRLSAQVAGGRSKRSGSDDSRVEAIGTAGRQPEWLAAEWLAGIEEQLDLMLCEHGAACHCARLARRHLREQRLDEATITITKALEGSYPSGTDSSGHEMNVDASSGPGVELWWLDLAIEIALERAEWRRAGALLERALELAAEEGKAGETEHTAAWRLRLDRRQAQLAGRVEEESAALKALRQLQPDEPQWALDLGRLELDHKRNCGGSHAWLDKAWRLGAERSLLAKVDVDMACGDLAGAPKHLEAFLDRFPSSPAAELRRARLQRLTGDSQEAKERLGRERDDAPMLLELARLTMDQGLFELAQDELEAYRRLATWPRGQHDAAIGRGLASLLADDPEAALRAAERAERAWLPETDQASAGTVSVDSFGPGLSVEALWLRGWAHLLEGLEKDALEQASKIKEQCRMQGSRRGLELARHLEGLVAARRGDWQSAVTAFYDALKLHPREESLFRLELARAFVQIGEPARASEELAKILDKNPRHAPALCELGALLEEEDDDKGARERYAEAFSVWNEQPEDRPMQECLERQRLLDTAFSTADRG